MLFPLRWIVQNAVRYLAHGPVERLIVRERVLVPMFGSAASAVERDALTDDLVADLSAAPYHEKQALAERVAERLIGAHYPAIMAFYVATLRAFFAHHRVPQRCYDWLLEDVTRSRNAITELPPAVDPAAVWDGREFDIDIARGQVVRMRGGAGP